MNDDEMAAGFDEWLRQYTEDPDSFEHTVKSVLDALAERKEGKELTYGASCVATLYTMARKAKEKDIAEGRNPLTADVAS